MLLALHFAIVLAFIVIGARYGGIAIGFAGGAGCAVTVARVTPEVKRGTVFVPYQELSQMQAMRGADDARFLAVRVETEVA